MGFNSADCKCCGSSNTIEISSSTGVWHCRQCGCTFNGKGHE